MRKCFLVISSREWFMNKRKESVEFSVLGVNTFVTGTNYCVVKTSNLLMRHHLACSTEETFLHNFLVISRTNDYVFTRRRRIFIHEALKDILIIYSSCYFYSRLFISFRNIIYIINTNTKYKFHFLKGTNF